MISLRFHVKLLHIIHFRVMYDATRYIHLATVTTAICSEE
jgi:hypothetical protein